MTFDVTTRAKCMRFNSKKKRDDEILINNENGGTICDELECDSKKMQDVLAPEWSDD